jgi:hypothetical protein
MVVGYRGERAYALQQDMLDLQCSQERRTMAEEDSATIQAGGFDPDKGKRVLLTVGLVLELIMLAAGLWLAAWLVMRFAPSARTPGHWVLIIIAAVLAFNYGYLLALLLFRIVIPRPAEGHHPMATNGRVSLQVRRFMFNVLLVKARFDPPWAVMFSSVLTRIPPLSGLFTRFFGPHTPSVTMGDTVNLLDPHFVEAGRGVELGFNCTIIAHHFDNRGLYIRRVVIGDHAVIGGESTVMAGVEIGHHAVIGNRSVVRPNTKIGPHEFWAGTPAVKVRDLRPADDVQGAG